MSIGQDFEIELYFTRVQHSAERVRTMLLELRKRFDLTPFEFCKKVRIAPTEIPRSHPQITLNTWVRDDLSLRRPICMSNCIGMRPGSRMPAKRSGAKS
jgi:hypothetical protein